MQITAIETWRSPTKGIATIATLQVVASGTPIRLSGAERPHAAGYRLGTAAGAGNPSFAVDFLDTAL